MSAAPFTQTWAFPVSGPVSCVRLVGEAKLLVGAGSNAHVFDCRNPQFHVELEGLASPISALCSDKGCRRVVAGTDGGSLRLWDSETGQTIRTFSNCHRASITSVDFHPYGEFIASASRDSHVRIWDTRKKSCLQVYKVKNSSSNGGGGGGGCFMEVVRFGPDGRWAVSGDSKGVMRIFDMLKGEQIQELPSVGAPVCSIAFHPSRCNIAVTGSNGDLAVWDAERMEQALAVSEPGCSLADFSEQHLVWSGAGGKLERLSMSDWRKNPTLKCTWPQLDDLKCEVDGTIFAAQKQVTSVAVTMIGAPKSSSGGGAGSKAAAAVVQQQQQQRAPLANRGATRQPQAGAYPAPPPQGNNIMFQQQLSDENSGDDFVAGAGTPRGGGAAVVEPPKRTPPPAPIAGAAAAVESYPLSSPHPAPPPPPQPTRAVNAAAAAAAGAGAVPSGYHRKTEDQQLDEALERSDRMSALLQRRVTHTRVFRSLWQQHPDRALVHLEQSMMQDKSDCGAVIDFFICLHQQRVKEKVTVEHVPTLLRLVQMVLQEHHVEAFVISALQALRYVNSKFRGRIEETLRGATAAAPGVDLSMESRLDKARQCYRLLCEVRALVTQFVARPDAVGEEARVLARDLPNPTG